MALTALSVLASITRFSRARASAPLTVFELRNYQTQPRRRDDLIAMFERCFLDAYTRAGSTILGKFRNADVPDRWFWIRAFPDLSACNLALKGFCRSQDWLTRWNACNATILDVSDVLLMRPAFASTIDLPPSPAAAAIEPVAAQSLIELTSYPLRPDRAAAFLDVFVSQVLPLLRADGEYPEFILAPQLLGGPTPKPQVRDDPVLVTVMPHESAAAHTSRLLARQPSIAWFDVNSIIALFLSGATEACRLVPTDRSWLR